MKSKFVRNLTKLEIVRKFDQNRNFSKFLDKTKIHRKFGEKSKVFENLTNIESFREFD